MKNWEQTSASLELLATDVRLFSQGPDPPGLQSQRGFLRRLAPRPHLCRVTRRLLNLRHEGRPCWQDFDLASSHRATNDSCDMRLRVGDQIRARRGTEASQPLLSPPAELPRSPLGRVVPQPLGGRSTEAQSNPRPWRRPDNSRGRCGARAAPPPRWRNSMGVSAEGK